MIILRDISVFIFGLIVGSFSNVCIYRMPREESVVKPRSHCPVCKKNIPWYDNIPILSYILLKAKCRSCGVRIPLKYPLVELITALLFVAVVRVFGLNIHSIGLLVLVCGLIISSFIDIDFRIIPDIISVGGIAVGLILGLINRSIVGSLLGVLIGGGVIYLTGRIGDFIFKKESMGGGDVKFLAMIGAFLGWKLALLTFFIAPLFGAVVGIYHKIRTKDSTIPYGPFLALGALIALFWGERIIKFFFPI